MSSKKSFLIVDDHLVVRKGIEIILKQKFPGCEVLCAEDYIECLNAIRIHKIDLIFLDINVNGVENIKIIQEIKELDFKVKILVFSSHEEKNYGLRYVKSGADGYLNKFVTEDKLFEAVQFLFEKGYFYSKTLKEKLDNSGKKAHSNPIELLSNREYEIANLLISGHGNLEIANKLDIQMSTVSTYKNRLFEKLNINNVVALAEMFKQNL